MADFDKADVVIAGGGVAGLMLAARLVRALGARFRVSVHDPSLGARAEHKNIRAYAISAFGCRQLDALGIWPALAAKAQPINRMIVTDSRADELVRPIFLRFEGEIAPGEAFAHMIAERDLLAALCGVLREMGVLLSSTAVMQSDAGSARRRVTLSDGREIRASLVVAADGRRSRLREAAGISFYNWDYRQNGIVVAVRHQRGHGGCAEEHFLASGPFAILPMKAADGSDTEASIVWTEDPGRARRLCAMDADQFAGALQEKFGHHFGPVQPIGAAETYPLSFGIARRFFADRLALLGDSAHVIHPLAGQGLNLGLKDAAALADLVVADARAGLDIGSRDLLTRYDRARRFDTTAMAATTDTLNRLFSNDSAPIRALRDFGLRLVDRATPVKTFLIGEAAGVRPQRPKRRVAG